MNFEKIQKDYWDQVSGLDITQLEQINRNIHLLMERPENEDLLYDEDAETDLARYLDACELVISRILLIRLIERKRGYTDGH